MMRSNHHFQPMHPPPPAAISTGATTTLSSTKENGMGDIYSGRAGISTTVDDYRPRHKLDCYQVVADELFAMHYVFDQLAADDDDENDEQVPSLVISSYPSASVNQKNCGTLESVVSQTLVDDSWLVPPGRPEHGVHDDDDQNESTSGQKDVEQYDDNEPWFNHDQVSDAAPTAYDSTTMTDNTSMDAMVPCFDLTCDPVDQSTDNSVLGVNTCLPKTKDSRFQTLLDEGCYDDRCVGDQVILKEEEVLSMGYANEDGSKERNRCHVDYDESIGDVKINNGGKRCGERSSSSSTKRKRIREPTVHNETERKRRDDINQKMNCLHGLVPNSNKTDKVSMLGEVINYVKQLKAQNEQMMMMIRMNMQYMMMQPMSMQQQHLQMPMMISQMGFNNMGMAMMPVTDMNSLMMKHPHPKANGTPTVFHPAAFNPYVPPYHPQPNLHPINACPRK